MLNNPASRPVSRGGCRSPAKDTPRTGPSISGEMVPSTKPWMALPSGCIAGSLEFRKFTLAGRRA